MSDEKILAGGFVRPNPSEPAIPVREEWTRDRTLKSFITAQDSTSDGLLANPLAGLQHRQLRALGCEFVHDYDLGEENNELFAKAAILAQDNMIWKDQNGAGRQLALNVEELSALSREETHMWDQPWALYSLMIVCMGSAAVQGWNETAVNGANIFYQKAFGLHPKPNPNDPSYNPTPDELIYGLINSAPYLGCALIGCWLTSPLNRILGRRGTIFVTCLVSSVTCLGQGLAKNWQQMLVARLLLGLAIGAKSATVPIYAAESVPARIRGSLVMMWQMHVLWTAFGIAVGLIAGAALYNVGIDPDCRSLNWRLMIGSPMILPPFLCAYVYFCPESPRWYMKKGPSHYNDAFNALKRLRRTSVQSARDLFYIHCLITAERHIRTNHRRFSELFSVPRNRRAMVASSIVMFLQQMCGVNIIVYYSAEVIYEATGNPQRALLASMGFGFLNFIFAIPAIKTIDSWGRRSLLLFCFPLMAIFMTLTSLSFLTSNLDIRAGLVLTSMYLFTIAYSPSEGPVPFTYSAECHALHIRDLGMSFATALTWLFNWMVSFTWPMMDRKMRSHGSKYQYSPEKGIFQWSAGFSGGFAFYAGWNVVGFFLILLFVPETKGRTLEELDKVFEVSSREHAWYGVEEVLYIIKRFVLRRERPTKPLLVCDRKAFNGVYDSREDVRGFPE
ncbi:hypothetical protein BDD12DRAFT_787358 [Trichophaea hybrida]|nr:hypothetical protein BDD12DRAFT_787358 [Trichophaea hybrida]